MNATLTHAAWSYPFEYAETYWTATLTHLATHVPSLPAYDPEWADDVDGFVASRLVFSDEDPVGTRVVLVRRTTGRARFAAYQKKNHRPASSAQPSTSDDARVVAYTSTSRAIVVPSPAGRKVFVARTGGLAAKGHRTSVLLGLGRSPAVSGNGRYVAYVRPDGRVVRRDLVRRRTVVLAGTPVPGIDDLAVADTGALVWSQRSTHGARRVVLRTAKATTVVGASDSPVITDNGLVVAYAGGRRYPDGVYGGVLRYRTDTGTAEVVATGPDGGPTRVRVDSLEMDGSGRYVVVAPDDRDRSLPLVPGSEPYRAVRFDMDAS